MNISMLKCLLFYVMRKQIFFTKILSMYYICKYISRILLVTDNVFKNPIYTDVAMRYTGYLGVINHFPVECHMLVSTNTTSITNISS